MHRIQLFGLHGGPTYLRLDAMLEQMRSFVHPDVLVFASDPYGNYFGMALAGSDCGAIYFLDHEGLEPSRTRSTRISTSFQELVDRAGGLDVEVRPAATSVEGAIRGREREALAKLFSSGQTGRGQVHLSVSTGDVEIVRMVLNAGGDANERGAINGTETPLFVAARQGRADIAALLLEHGADPNARCSAGGAPIEMAVPFPHVLRLMARAGAQPTTASIAEAVRRVL